MNTRILFTFRTADFQRTPFGSLGIVRERFPTQGPRKRGQRYTNTQVGC